MDSNESESQIPGQSQSERQSQFQASKQMALDQTVTQDHVDDEVFMQTEPVSKENDDDSAAECPTLPSETNRSHLNENPKNPNVENEPLENKRTELASEDAMSMDCDKENINLNVSVHDRVNLLDAENTSAISNDNANANPGAKTVIIVESIDEADGKLKGTMVSVKEGIEKFNTIASESELTLAELTTTTSPGKMASSPRMRREQLNKLESGDDDGSSVSSFGYGFAHLHPREKEWIYKVSARKCGADEFAWLNKAAQENPELVKRKDVNTALHWAAKHGHLKLIQLFAGTFRANVNARSNGGYTPLHLAAQFDRQEVYDMLAKSYLADMNIRDHSGKKPMQYLVRTDLSASSNAHQRLSKTLSTNSTDLVSLPMSNTNSSTLESSPSSSLSTLPTSGSGNGTGTGTGTGADASGDTTTVERTGLVTLTAYVNRSPSIASAYSRVRAGSFRSKNSPPHRSASSASTSVAAKNWLQKDQNQKQQQLGGNTSDSGSIGSEGKPVHRIPSFLTPFKSSSDMRKSFRQGVKNMWNGHPKGERDQDRRVPK